VTCLLQAAMASGSTVHICSWLGFWRTILGQLFSGEFNTANWNTLYHMIAWECYVLWEAAGGDKDAPPPAVCATRTSDPMPGSARACVGYDCKSLLNDPCVFAKLQGDDGVCTAPADSPLSLSRQRYFFKKYLDITIKVGPPTEENDFFFTLPAPDGNILREGVVFLQRRFIRIPVAGGSEIVPFRPARDYWGRVGRGTGVPPSDGSVDDELTVMAYYRMRWVGLLYDTMETNPQASQFVRACLEWLDTTNPLVEDYVQHLIQDPDRFDPVMARQLREMKAYSLKITPDDIGINFVKIPRPGKILRRFTLNGLMLEQRKRELETRLIQSQPYASA